MATALHRINGGEVLKISPQDQSFSSRDPTYWGALVDPPLPDGNQVRDLTVDPPGPLRVLGLAKIWDGVDVRNATQGEIDNFPIAEATDESLMDAEDAQGHVDGHPLFRKVTKAHVRQRVAWTNLQADKIAEVLGQWNQFKADLSANNFATLKTLVDAYAVIADDLPSRDVTAATAAFKASIDPDD